MRLLLDTSAFIRVGKPLSDKRTATPSQGPVRPSPRCPSPDPRLYHCFSRPSVSCLWRFRHLVSVFVSPGMDGRSRSRGRYRGQAKCRGSLKWMPRSARATARPDLWRPSPFFILHSSFLHSYFLLPRIRGSLTFVQVPSTRYICGARLTEGFQGTRSSASLPGLESAVGWASLEKRIPCSLA
jgi:hypothetical protein